MEPKLALEKARSKDRRERNKERGREEHLPRLKDAPMSQEMMGFEKVHRFVCSQIQR